MVQRASEDVRRRDVSISAFFPAYNDGGTITSMVMSVDMVLRSVTSDYEIIVVNDGSADYTREMLDELERHYDHLRVIHHPVNRGYGGALCSGFCAATKDLIFYTDGDAQYDPRELRKLLEAFGDGVDLVNGYKMERGDPLHRKIIGRVYHWGVKLAFGLKLRDVDCDFRLMRRSIFDQVQLCSNSGVICVELMKKTQDAGFVIAQVPVHHYHRAYGVSQFFNFRRVYKTLADLGRLWLDLVLFKKPSKVAVELEQPRRDALEVAIKEG
ncbi:MAG: glycosyltransferase family 2 protein [Chloroflexi bacterium]|nr:glycosyltransferase family 2 protein [Chloroflexota bacterium]